MSLLFFIIISLIILIKKLKNNLLKRRCNMNYKTHKIGGICFSLIAMVRILPMAIGRFNNDFLNILTIISAMIGGMFGGLLPDIDTPTSKASKSLGIVSKSISIIINKTFGHRKNTHTIWFVAIVTIILSVFIPFINILFKYLYISFVYGVFWGLISHLFLDSLTKKRIKPFAPLWEIEIGIPIFKVKKNEYFVAFLLIISTILLLGIL